MPNKLLYLALVAFTMGCNKTNTINVPQPTACFTTYIKEVQFNSLRPGSTNFIDSDFYFRNCSDSSDLITYSWNFGDGSSSTDKNPAHRYSKRGKYTVTLIANNNNLVTDTLRITVSVIAGQKEISFGENKNVYPIAIDETATGEFLLLGSTDWSTGYFLMQIDSLLNQKDQPEYLPASYRLTNMKPAGDGNYIFTGTTSGNTRDNELIKLKPDGSLIWNKLSTTADDNYSTVTLSPDGGLVVVGSSTVIDQYNNPIGYSRIKKFDRDGNMKWDRSLFAEGMQYTKDAAVEQDGVIVAGKKRSMSCYECDSIIIAKLNNNGDLVWKTIVYGGLNASINTMSLIKHSTGNYVVATENTRGIFIFSPAGQFLDRQLMNYSITAVSNTKDGNLAVLQTESGNGFRGAVTKIKMDGTPLWHVTPNGQQQTGGGWLCCVDSWPISVQPLRNGGTLAMMRRVNRTSNYNYYYVISFMPLDENGLLQ